MKKVIWNLIEVIVTLYAFVRSMKEYRRIQRTLLMIEYGNIQNVKEVMDSLKLKNTYEKTLVIVRGFAKAVSQDRNIFSIIKKTDLRQTFTQPSFLERINWYKIVKEPFWRRPFNLKKIAFLLKDTTSEQALKVSNCQRTNVTGAINQVYRTTVLLKEKAVKKHSAFVGFIKATYNFISSMTPFPLNYIIRPLKHGEELQHYGILDGQYILAIGEAYRNSKGKVVIDNPYYLTKQRGFIVARLKKRLNFLYYLLGAIGIIGVFILYRILKVAIQWEINRRNLHKLSDEDEKRSEDEGDFCNCVICYTNIRSVVLKPCKHYAFCEECYNLFKEKEECPVCKSEISGIVRVIKK